MAPEQVGDSLLRREREARGVKKRFTLGRNPNGRCLYLALLRLPETSVVPPLLADKRTSAAPDPSTLDL